METSFSTRSINRKPPVQKALKATNENRAQAGDSEGLDLEKNVFLSLSEDVGAELQEYGVSTAKPAELEYV